MLVWASLLIRAIRILYQQHGSGLDCINHCWREYWLYTSVCSSLYEQHTGRLCDNWNWVIPDQRDISDHRRSAVDHWWICKHPHQSECCWFVFERDTCRAMFPQVMVSWTYYSPPASRALSFWSRTGYSFLILTLFPVNLDWRTGGWSTLKVVSYGAPSSCEWLQTLF